MDVDSTATDQAVWDDVFANMNEASINPFASYETTDDMRVQTVDQPRPVLGAFKMLCAANQPDKPMVSPNFSSTAIRRLSRVYFEHVDPVVKVLHRPSVTRFMERDEPYLDFPDDHASVAALRSAINYAAACSLSERQCWALFRESQPPVVSWFQDSCENALERADVLLATDLTVLQGLVLYIVGRLSKGPSRAVWSLVSLAVRLAKAMCLDFRHDPTVKQESESFFQRQMRKRLWLTVCVIDLQAAFAHGSQPLIQIKDVSSALDGLKHIDDTQFEPNTPNDLTHEETPTDVTFPFVVFLAQVSGRLLHSTPHSISASGGDSGIDDVLPGFKLDQNAREQASAAFEQKAFTLLRFCDPESSYQAWYTWHSTQALVTATRLAALRSPERDLSSTEDPWPPNHCQEQRATMELGLGTRVLQKFHLIYSDNRSEGLRWYLKVPWQALDVVVARCRECKDEALTHRAWPLVEFAWQVQKSHMECHDQVAALEMGNRIRQGREALRSSSQPRPLNTASTLCTPLHSPTILPSGSLTSFPFMAPTGIAETLGTASDTATNSHSIQSPFRLPTQDTISAPAELNSRTSEPTRQAMDHEGPPFQMWDSALLGSVDDYMTDADGNFQSSSSEMALW